MMRAGRLRHRLTFQDKTVSRDGYGAEDITWTDSFTVWGSVEPLMAREYLDQRQQQAEVTHRVRIRYRSGVKPSMRIQFDLDSRDAQYLEIESIIEPYVRGTEMQLMCVEYRED